MKFKIWIAALILQICFVVTVQAQTVHLSVAASMTDAFNDIIAAFTTSHSNAEILPNFASSGSLAKQIHQGAPADIYVSANPKWMKYLVEENFIASGTDRIFAYNQLVFVGAEKTTALSLENISTLDRIAIGTPQSVPAGQYAKQAMDKAGIYTTLEQANKLVMAKDVRQALIYADRGEVDGAFIYKTDALLAKQAKILFTVPEDLYDRVSYPVALTVEGAQNETAKALYEYLQSPEAVAILSKYGFEAKQ